MPAASLLKPTAIDVDVCAAGGAWDGLGISGVGDSGASEAREGEEVEADTGGAWEALDVDGGRPEQLTDIIIAKATAAITRRGRAIQNLSRSVSSAAALKYAAVPR